MENALIDNSGFAGLMRCYLPDHENHKKFLDDFPEHKVIDYVSSAQMLTAICLYDTIFVEGSSSGHFDSVSDVIPNNSKTPARNQCSSWVNDLCKELPFYVSEIIYSEPLFEKEIEGLNERSRELAFNLFNSDLKSKIRLSKNCKIPNVYYSPTYVERDCFLEINKDHGSPLSEEELTQVMFLHRGLLLEAVASEYGSTIYFPYSYRGNMLSDLPPGVSSRIFDTEGAPLIYEDTTPNEQEVMNLVNKVYYETLEQLTWTKYDNFIPFIGASILSTSNYDIKVALEIAVEYRHNSNLREIMHEINEWSHEKVMFEGYLEHFRKELNEAGNRFKVHQTTDKLESMANLTMFWLPFGLKDPALEIVKMLPSKWQSRINNFFSKIESLEGHQMLLVDHVKAIRNVQSELAELT